MNVKDAVNSHIFPERQMLPFSATEAQSGPVSAHGHTAGHEAVWNLGSWTQSPYSLALRHGWKCDRSQRHLEARMQLLAGALVP